MINISRSSSAIFQGQQLVRPVRWKVSAAAGRSNVGDTIWLFNIAMENGPFIDGLPI